MAKKSKKRTTKTAKPKPTKPVKARKPRVKKPEVVVTTEPAVNTVWPSHAVHDFLKEVETESTQVVSEEVSITAPVPPIAASGRVYIANYPGQKIVYDEAKKNVDGWATAAHEVYDDFISKMKKSDFTTQIRDFAFAHPLIFGIAFATSVLIVVAGFGIVSRIFGW